MGEAERDKSETSKEIACRPRIEVSFELCLTRGRRRTFLGIVLFGGPDEKLRNGIGNIY